ncbi:MAG: XRE family transcriptional regulator [Acidobacteriota bacterium]
MFASTSAPIETGVDRHALVQRTLLVEEGEWAPTKLMGARLLALREAHGWSLEQVASAAGVPARHLRRIEDGRKQAPLDAVLKLARAFGKPVGELTGETLEQGPWYFVQRSAEIASVPNRLRRTPVDVSSAPPSKTCQRLAGGFPTKHMYPYFVRLLNVNIDSLTLHEHHGHEFLYVLEGEVELRTYAGDQPVTEILRPGDCCYLDSTVPHLVHAQSRNPYSETAAEVLDIFWTPLGERYLFAEEVLQGSQA